MNKLTQLYLAARSRGQSLIDATRSEEGATTVEYIILVVGVIVIAGIVIAAVTAFVTAKAGTLSGS